MEMSSPPTKLPGPSQAYSVRAPHTKISTVAASGKAASRPVRKMRRAWRAVVVMGVGEVR